MKTTDFKNIMELLHAIEYNNEKITFDDVIAADAVISDKIIDPLQKSGNDEWLILEDIIARSESRYEEQGFINGFIYAMQLQAESNMLFGKEVAKAVC